jgi:signal transduction histidine kinase
MKLPRISLAAKYRILFGLAVLLIIAAALYVPWRRMSALLLEQPYREAQRAADDYFRLVLASPAAAGSVHGHEFSLLPEGLRGQPRFIGPPRGGEGSASAPAAEPLDSFAVKALRSFARPPKREATYAIESLPDGKRLHYARAVWVTRGCLECHGEGKNASRTFAENELAGVITISLPVERGDQQMLLNQVFIVGAGALAGVLAILVFYFITHRFILSPINELQDVALRVSEGDLGVRSHLRTGDEFEQLADSMNVMLERLRTSQDELRKANELLDQKLEDMAQSNVALFEANRLKSEFLANVSHELRTPLTSIIGFAELIREGPPGESNGKTSRYAENILISGRILLEIINDLLDLAKIEAGRVELRVEPVMLGELCSSLIDFMRPAADKKNIQLTCTLAEGSPEVQTDRGRLRQILFNLLSNAIKFTPDGGGVHLTCERGDDGQVRLAVTDNGPGIAPDQQAVIFEKFRQVDQSATREHHGTGLGLAIAKELTQLLGGRIGVESQLGLGSTFWLLLPAAAPRQVERRLISLTG